MPRVYAGLPLRGPSGPLGRDVLRGAELALERAHRTDLELVVAETGGGAEGDREELAVAAARRAAGDPEALAYLGDFHSSQIMETAPILGEAGLLQVSPVATFAGLEGSTLVRLAPHDGVGAQAIADWLVGKGVGDLLVVHDHDDDYGTPVGAMCTDAARDRGIDVRSRPVWNHDEPPVADLGDAEAVLYVGVAGSGAVSLWHELHRARPDMWLLGSEGVAAEWLAHELDPAAADRTRFFVAYHAPLAFYGYAAMEHILDAIAGGDGDRAATARAGRATHERDSVLGRYALDGEGHTTTTAYGRLAIADGELVPDREG